MTHQSFLSQFHKGMKQFVSPLIAVLAKKDLHKDILEIDHVCYRVGNSARYEHLKQQMGSFSVLLSEAFVNGRPIATFKMKNPLCISENIAISVVEIPSPKTGTFYAEGFEHIEAVVSCRLEEFMLRHSEFDYDKKNLNASINRDISIKFPEGLIKFHELSLEKVIALESDGAHI